MAQAVFERLNQRVEVFGQSRVQNAAIILGGSLLMAVCAHLSMTLWFTPVPLTLQTFGVMLLALTLGGWRASAALVVYLLEGISGLPVFSPHGPGGIAQILGPTGGYLMAYPLAALAGGLISEKLARPSRLAALAAGAVVIEFVIFMAGSLWLFALTHKPASFILNAAVLPFLPGEIFKGAAAVAAALGWRAAR